MPLPPSIELHYDEAEGRLPDVCMRCGAPAVCRVKKTIRCHDWMGAYGKVGFLALFRMFKDTAEHFSSPTLELRGPFCARHRNHWAVRRLLIWSVLALLPLVLAGALLLNFAAGQSGWAGGLFIFGTTALILATCFVYGTSIVKHRIDDDEELIELRNVHPRFITAVEQQRAKKKPARTAPKSERSVSKQVTPAVVPVKAVPASAASPFEDLYDEDAENDQPRYRRSRRSNSNQTALVIALGVGIPLLLIACVGTIITLIVATELAEREHHEGEPQAVVAPAPPPPEIDRDVEPGTPVPKSPPFPPLPAELANRPSIDLIPLIQPRKDVVHGHWLRVGKELHCNDAHFVLRMQLPYIPPEEYDFVVTFSQPALRNGISLVMPNPNGGFFWYLGSDNGAGYGFHANPNKGGQIPGLIKANTVHTTTVQVRRASVRALLDGKELLAFPTDFRDLLCDDWRRIHNTKFLAIACDDPTVFHYVRLVEISGHGKKGR